MTWQAMCGSGAGIGMNGIITHNLQMADGLIRKDPIKAFLGLSAAEDGI